MAVNNIKSNGLLAVHHSESVSLNQRDALFIQFIENQVPLHISSITCSSSGFAAQTAFGILRTSVAVAQLQFHCNRATATDIIRTQYTKCRCVSPPGDEQVMLETCTGI
jgi:hypothetical protein